MTMLDCEATEVAKRLGVDYLEYRTEHRPDTDWLVKGDLYAGFCKPLSGDTNKDFADVPRKRRAMLRKAISSGMTSDFSRDIGGFYKLYAESVRNLGTPVYGIGFFQNLVDEFPDDCTILSFRLTNQAVSGVLSFSFRDRVLPYFAGARSDARQLAANDFMYWELMRRSGEHGIKYFDFGRSKIGTGAYAYKSIWGFKAEPLSYSYRLFNSSSLPEVNPTNPKYRLAIAAWKRLPLSVANFLGPFIARDLG
jgi:FemAB-related protein (PEP-CTERM system-associated)